MHRLVRSALASAHHGDGRDEYRRLIDRLVRSLPRTPRARSRPTPRRGHLERQRRRKPGQPRAPTVRTRRRSADSSRSGARANKCSPILRARLGPEPRASPTPAGGAQDRRYAPPRARGASREIAPRPHRPPIPLPNAQPQSHNGRPFEEPALASHHRSARNSHLNRPPPWLPSADASTARLHLRYCTRRKKAAMAARKPEQRCGLERCTHPSDCPVRARSYRRRKCSPRETAPRRHRSRGRADADTSALALAGLVLCRRRLLAWVGASASPADAGRSIKWPTFPVAASPGR
jgi:hypothetical protein